MKSNTNGFVEHKALAELHSDCRSWRQVAFECVHAGDRIPTSTEEHYRVVHGRILASCRNLATEKKVTESHRQVALQLDELLRPWPSGQSLKEAPANIVTDLVKSQTILDAQLSGGSTRPVGPRGRLMVTAFVAAAGGILAVLLLQVMGGRLSALVQPVHGWLASVVTYVGNTSFTERFAVAILLSWLVGTWLLSRLSKG